MDESLSINTPIFQEYLFKNQIYAGCVKEIVFAVIQIHVLSYKDLLIKGGGMVWQTV